MRYLTVKLDPARDCAFYQQEVAGPNQTYPSILGMVGLRLHVSDEQATRMLKLQAMKESGVEYSLVGDRFLTFSLVNQSSPRVSFCLAQIACVGVSNQFKKIVHPLTGYTTLLCLSLLYV